MAGIYIHIPFCKQACSYCNFHFSTTAKHREEIIDGILREIEDRAGFFEKQAIKSIYFGGGTPSLLDQTELGKIFKQLEANFELGELEEVTLEANPDDLNQKKLNELKSTPINRLSIGIQSLHQKDLHLMNRAHNAEEGINSVKRALDSGFDRLNLDLIFGIPNSSLKEWEESLKAVFALDFDHLSAYALTMEEGTLYHHQVKKGLYKELEDHQVAEQYQLLQDYIKDLGWEQYELSNYCRNDKIAIHNTAYWMNEKYLGIGPSAHSYDGTSRRWNVANNHLYYQQMLAGQDYFETEQLKEADRYHELLISRLRTKWGISWQHISDHFTDSINSHYTARLKELEHLLDIDEDAVRIKREYWFTSDQVLREMMLSE